MTTRKNIRLQGHDYSRNGAYFVTICTKDRQCLFWKDYDLIPCVGAHSVRPHGKIRLSQIGLSVKESFRIIMEYYPMVWVDKYVIMPNHIHAIIRIDSQATGTETAGRTECAPTLSQIIKNFKENVTRKCGFHVWQRSFYDRVIRNEDEYAAYWRYIENNPINWENDDYY